MQTTCKLHVCISYILAHFRFSCRYPAKPLCFGQRTSTASFVFLNAPPAPRDLEQHCGIDYRLKASRKICEDDGESVSGYSPHLKVQSASIHQSINEY